MSVLATIVPEFGESVAADQQFCVIELDDAVNLDADGKVVTGFAPDDLPGFVVHYDPAVLRIDRVECSSGSIAGGSRVSRSRTRQMSFSNNETEQELSHIPAGSLSWNWRFSGSAVSAGERVNSPAVVQDGRKLRAAGTVPALGKVTYSIQCNAYRLTPPDLTLDPDDSSDTWSVLVVVYMEAI